MRAAIDIRDVPEEIRAAVDREAAERDMAINDVVGEILASRYGLKWTRSSSSYQGGGSDHWLLRMPVKLRDTLRGHAENVDGTLTGVVLLNLAARYGLPTQSPRRRGGGLDEALVAEARRRHAAGESLRALSRDYGIKRETLTKAIRGR
jgi:hypothetical protein